MSTSDQQHHGGGPADNDAQLLAEIGRAIHEDERRGVVTIPQRLAEQAIAAWNRDDSHELGVDGGTIVPLQGATSWVTLIGAAAEEAGEDTGSELEVELAPDVLLAALHAAGRDGTDSDSEADDELGE